MKTRPQRLPSQLLLLAILAALWPGSLARAQESTRNGADKAISYAFVSPNTRENLTTAEAIRELGSPEEARLIRDTHQVGCRLRLRLRVSKALGSWADGAEHSTVFRVTADAATVRYAAAWLGKFARQKAVLYFLGSGMGQARLHILSLRKRDLASVAKAFDSTGVAFRNLVPARKRLLVYVVDLKNELKTKVSLTARRLHASLWSMRGEGAFIGDENDREKAQTVFEEEIRRYEATHAPLRASCPN